MAPPGGRRRRPGAAGRRGDAPSGRGGVLRDDGAGGATGAGRRGRGGGGVGGVGQGVGALSISFASCFSCHSVT